MRREAKVGVSCVYFNDFESAGDGEKRLKAFFYLFFTQVKRQVVIPCKIIVFYPNTFCMHLQNIVTYIQYTKLNIK